MAALTQHAAKRRAILGSQNLLLKSKVQLSLKVEYCSLLLIFGDWWEVVPGFFHSLSLSGLSRGQKQDILAKV